MIRVILMGIKRQNIPRLSRIIENLAQIALITTSVDSP